MRVLAAFDEDHRAYGDVIAATIEVLRPRVAVRTALLESLAEEIGRFDPHLVICSRPNAAGLGGTHAWVELSLDPLRPTRICVGGRRSQQINPKLEAVLAVIDEVEELIQADDCSTCC